MRTLLALAVTLALMCGAANAQVPGDMIDLSKADFYGTNVSEWAPTVALTGVELRSGSNLGVRAEFDRAHVNSRWPDVLMAVRVRPLLSRCPEAQLAGCKDVQRCTHSRARAS